MIVEILRTVLLAVHLVAVNLAAGAPLAAAWLLAGSSQLSDGRRALGRRAVVLTLCGLAAGVVLGTVMTALAGEAMWDALRRFPARAYWFAGLEVVFSAACGAILWRLAQSGRPNRFLVWLVALASTSNLLYHFPLLLIAISKLAVDPTWASQDVIDRPALRHLALQPEVFVLWIHVALSSLAVAAVAVLAVAPANELQFAASKNGAAPSMHATRRLAVAALGVSLLQLPVGTWLLIASPQPMREAVLGGSLLASGLLAAGLAAALQMMKSLGAIALGETDAKSRRRAMAWTLVVVVLMSAALRTSRGVRAAPSSVAAADYYSSAGSSSTFSSSPPGSLPARNISP